MTEAEQVQDDLNEQEPETVSPTWEDERATLMKERDDYLDQWKRSAAEFINYKKREERLRMERERYANQRVLLKLLPLIDDFRRALQHRPEELVENEWANGILAIERKLWTALEQEGVSVINAEPGASFDPNLHDAMLSQEQDGTEAGIILAQIERGYKQGEFVLRPARVVVSK